MVISNGLMMPLGTTAAKQREKRWIVLADDGRHVTIGRNSDPAEEEISQVAKGLAAAGRGGWLAVMEGVYYGRGAVSLLQVRELVRPAVPWHEATRAFLERRAQQTRNPASQ